ncbi:Protein CBG15597 [Caenorhabditis briggsae]|uniref:Protein CBG15597 n=1 Tax=Caenorhabditis briggsae TaxID=6238 RepID=A8XMD8_CAEBR|nr:Protein CBG15597 [Caenorhabditis briggsae]CAP33813.2 Protein CBG15597 [Caenorhabditis briggsae]
MRENAGRLQSHYDTRATILDILKYQPSSNFTDRSTLQIPGEKGNSYLRHQPSTPRNCETLPIPEQYCICQSNTTSMLKDKKLIERLSKSLIDYVHGKLDGWNLTSLCHKFEVEKVTVLDLHISKSTSKSTYDISVKTKHAAHFETLITEDKKTKNLEFGGITRLDKYKDTADCSKPIRFTPLCYCRK